MQPDEQPLSAPALLALASESLVGNGYRVARDLGLGALPADTSLLAEDDFGVVAIATYDTWSQLQAEWTEAQAELVSLLARRLARSAPKAWDGYLVLLCASFAPDSAAISQIERDTTRIRKLVATADMLKSTRDFLRILDIFLPLEIPQGARAIDDVLDVLPELMSDQVDPQAVRVVVDAFRELEPPLERLHSLSGGQ
jgi:hypothetical protein